MSDANEGLSIDVGCRGEAPRLLETIRKRARRRKRSGAQWVRGGQSAAGGKGLFVGASYLRCGDITFSSTLQYT